ncbi:MAG: transketolase C-terminal domain-containing protein [Dehalococcoidia bacterium]
MKYWEAIAESLVNAMRDDPKVIILGEGITDPKGIFGTTVGAYQIFPERVIETPLSENMLTGACLGLALEGWKPIFVHARCDFIMTAMGHLVNTVAKWRSVHHDQPVNLVVRGLVGRGWGQGPHHSQALHAMFAHIPGLRVLYPVHPAKVHYWMKDALSCGWPTIIMEPRRVYEVDNIEYPYWDKPDLHLITFGDVVLEAARAAQELERAGVKAQVYPIEDISAMPVPETDLPALVIDTGHLFCGAAAEVVARLSEQGVHQVRRVGPPFLPLPTSVELENQWYPSVGDIIDSAYELLDIRSQPSKMISVHDDRFKGPF